MRFARRVLRLLFFILAGLAIFIFAGVLLIQSFFAGILQDYVRNEFGWSLKIGSADLRFHPLSIRLESIELSAPGDAPFFQARSAYAALPYSSLWKDEFVVQEITVDSPRLDLNDFLKHFPPKKTGDSQKEAAQFQIQSLKITSAEVKWKEYIVEKIHAQARIDSAGMQFKELGGAFRNIDIKGTGKIQDFNKPNLNLTYDLHGDVSGVVSMFPELGDLRGNVIASGAVRGILPDVVISGETEKAALTLNGSEPFILSARYQYDLNESENPIRIEAGWNSVPLSLAKNYWKDAPPISSLSSGSLTYTGNTTDFWSGSGAMDASLIPGSGSGAPLAGELHSTLEERSLRVENSLLQMRSTRIAMMGTLNESQMNLKANLQSSNLSDLAFIERKLSRLPGIYRVQSEIAGPYNDLNIRAELHGQTKHSSVDAQGTFRTSNGNLSAQFDGNTEAKELQKLLPDLAEGNVHFQGSASGNFKNPEFNVQVEGTDLRTGNVRLSRASAQIDGRGNLLLFHAETPDFVLSAEGSYRIDSQDFEIRSKIDGISAGKIVEVYPDFPKDLTGSIRADFDARGNARKWKKSEAHLVIQETEMQWHEATVRIPAGEIRLERGIAQLDLQAMSQNTQMQVSGSISLLDNYSLDLAARGKVAGEIIERITPDWTAAGEVTVDLGIKGTPRDPDLKGRIVTDNMKIRYLPKEKDFDIEHFEASLSGSEINLQGNGSVSGSAFAFHGSVPLQNATGELHAEIRDLSVSMFTPNPNVAGRFDVMLDLQGKGFPLEEWKQGAKVQMPFHEWTGEILITPYDLKLGNNILSVEEPLRLSLQDRIVRLRPSRIKSGDMLDLQAAGSLNLDTGALESSVHTDARIDLLSSLKADIQSSGPVTLDLQVAGTLEKPEYRGTIELSHVSLRIPETPLSLEDLEVRASLDEKGLRLEKFQARSGGGSISGGGDLLRGVSGSRVRLQGNNVAMNYPEGLRSQLDFDLELTGQPSGLLLSGKIQILRSFYEDRLSLGSPIVRKLLESSTEMDLTKRLKSRVKLAINLQTVQDFRLKNALASLLGTADLKLEGNLYRPRLIGRISVREGGRIFLLGNQFEVEKANVDFFGSELLEPNLDVTLSALLRDYTSDVFYEVTIPFSGSTSGIEFRNVRSSPSLSEDQIFSLLTEGTTDTGQAGPYGSAFQRQLLSFLAGQAFGSPAAAVAKSIGLSRIQIQQEGLSGVNDPKTRLVLGKDIGAGFTLIYSFVLDDPQDQTWIASYRYGRNIVARFIDQDNGTYTTSVSHRILFGKGASLRSSFLEPGRPEQRGFRISAFVIRNDSVLTDKQIQNILKLAVGNKYEYWSFQDRADEIKKQLQKIDYLSPSVDVREKKESGDSIALTIEIKAGDLAQMKIHGYEPGDKALDRYKKSWRQGFSPFVVQQIISEDLLRQLRLSGYHQASVKTSADQRENQTDHSFDVTPGPRFKSVQLDFQGSGHYEPRTLQKDLNSLYGSSADMFVDAIHDFSSFQEKIKSLYLQLGYVRTEISAGETVFQPDTAQVVRRIVIEEGPLSRIAAIAPYEAIPELLRKQLLLRPGEPFYPGGLLEDELKIQSYFESEGYPDPHVNYDVELQKSSPDILIQWTLNPGRMARIASVRILGNQTTRSDLILKRAGLKEGDVLTPGKSSLARKHLSDLGVFQQVSLETEETDTPGEYDVVVHVTENKRYEFQYGVRYNTDDKLGGEIRLTDFNFLGRARIVGDYIRSTLDAPLYRLDYTLPITGSFWDRTRFSLFRDEQDDDVEATVSNELVRLPFTLKDTGFQFQQDQRFRSLRLLWGFEYASNAATITDLETLVPVTFEGTVARLRSALVADRRDDPVNAQKGYFLSADGEFAPTLFGTDISYSKFFSQYFYYRKFGGIVYAAGVRAGFLGIRSNLLTISEKFRTGGSTTLRGFGLNQVVPGDDFVSLFFGGNSVFILNQEIRFPIYKWFSGAVFYDGGNVYTLASDFDPLNLRHSAGFGIRAGFSGFVVRLDLGFNLDPQDEEQRTVLHFGIGQAF